MKIIKQWFMTGLLMPLLVVLLPGCKEERNVLFRDDFSQIQPQMVSGGVVGAFAEYHTIDAVRPVGNWLSSNYRSDLSQLAWRLIVEDNKHIMYQSYEEAPKTMAYMHPILVAGDSLWKDYSAVVTFSAESKHGMTGMLIRYQTDRHYYFVGVKGDSAMIIKMNGSDAFRKSNHIVLAKKPIDWKLNEMITAKVSVSKNEISASINNITLEANDSTFDRGKIGLLSDGPARFYNVELTANAAEFDEFKQRKELFEKELAELRANNPTPVVWKKIKTPDFGSNRNFRFGDLDNDGVMDILIGQVINHGTKDRNSELGCMTALSLDGKILWQVGAADLWNERLSSDVAFQIFDIDADGKNDVIYCKDMKLVVADGATGKTKYSVPTPKNVASAPYDKFPRILGDALYICNVEGNPTPQNILIKDRYENFYVYNSKLDLLWSGSCKTGHFPYAWDYDNDGKDEISVGYSLYDHDGKQLFSLDQQIQDHADGTVITKLKKDGPYVIMSAASDEGLLYYDLTGNILKHYQVGHAQNPVVCNLRDDLPGLESVVVNFWANQGIVNYMDADMNIYKTFEPFQQGSPMTPTNWSGRTEELVLLSTDPNIGGMLDGYGRNVVNFPADGHPDMCYAVLDVTGDCRDEIITWDATEIWIYTQSDNPKSGELYNPVKSPLYNFSNYSTAVSYPSGWFDNEKK